MATHSHTNRLIDETSPYLQQHAHNPVDWHAWGAEALEKARREDKPILLSIGYSACHWCHVMEHESFEDEAVANVMNELFVCIKVDREERPDLDKIYQTAHQIIAQRSGGWPLNMFLAPDDHMAFFGGTYFPKTPRYGMPGFVDVLRRVAQFYREQRADVLAQNEQIRKIFASLQPQQPPPGQQIAPDVSKRATDQLKRQYDSAYGGFGQAPKFPHPTSIEICLRQWARGRAAGNADPELLAIATHTLRAMARGGIYDQLGGGFCRYSVDDQWMIPHFEKMLYDNGQLLPLYADAFAATDDPLFRSIAIGTAAWVMREMQAPDGGYYSSLDADSEGHEGKFYVWDTPELKSLLTGDEWELIEARYGLHGTPNFEGQWNLHTALDTAALAVKFRAKEPEIEARLEAAQCKLLAARDKRIRPGRDDKILTSWNALMIKGMARAAWRLDRPDFLQSAQRAFDFVRATLWKDGRLLATAKDGKAHLNAYLDDYVFLIDAGLELLQAQWRGRDLEFISALAQTVIKHFADDAHGGFYFTADDHERLVHRVKPGADEATPSGNGIAAQVFLRLGHLLADAKYLAAAERTVNALYPTVAEYPAAHGTLVAAIDEYLQPPQIIILRGNEALPPWLERARRDYVPWRLVFGIPDDAAALPDVLASRRPLAEVTAYMCEGHACSAPIVTLSAFGEALDENQKPP